MCSYTSSSKKLDIDGDGLNDYIFWLITGHVLGSGDCYGSIRVYGIDSNKVADVVYNSGDTLKPGFNWINNLLLDNHPIDRYIAVKLSKVNPVYGWIKFSSEGYLKLVLKESAYFTY